ncbi:hypothetical protein HUT06_35185 [Actinomadura sp. NAK00032]|uniref:hypothetical protein n=1 Tax=Actinomadura sp. NAK00032 TaxID=2742128 RepID=UPI001591FB92|nr:hypothetical protein [Actinomadura sp. NAK00032]QKW38617.1 hypothetical protein HUT06_35185 [Actinomadura sp. NAK00032]
MSPDDIPDELPEGAYIARQTWRSNLPIVVILGAVDAFVLYQAIRNPGLGASIALTGFGGMTAIVGFFVARSVRRGEVSFAVDARSVYFGYTAEDAEPELIPWSWIDCVVTFDRIVRSGRQRTRHRYVGVELNAAGVTARMSCLPRPPELSPPTVAEEQFKEAVFGPWMRRMGAEPSLASQRIQGWRLDGESLAEAVVRYSPDTPIAERPTRRDPGIAGVAAAAWEMGKNLKRLSEQDDYRNDDDRQ